MTQLYYWLTFVHPIQHLYWWHHLISVVYFIFNFAAQAEFKLTICDFSVNNDSDEFSASFSVELDVIGAALDNLTLVTMLDEYMLFLWGAFISTASWIMSSAWFIHFKTVCCRRVTSLMCYDSVIKYLFDSFFDDIGVVDWINNYSWAQIYGCICQRNDLRVCIVNVVIITVGMHCLTLCLFVLL